MHLHFRLQSIMLLLTTIITIITNDDMRLMRFHRLSGQHCRLSIIITINISYNITYTINYSIILGIHTTVPRLWFALPACRHFSQSLLFQARCHQTTIREKGLNHFSAAGIKTFCARAPRPADTTSGGGRTCSNNNNIQQGVSKPRSVASILTPSETYLKVIRTIIITQANHFYHTSFRKLYRGSLRGLTHCGIS